MGLRFILNGRVIDEGETLGQEAINTEQTGGLVFKKIEADHSQDPDTKKSDFRTKYGRRRKRKTAGSDQLRTVIFD